MKTHNKLCIIRLVVETPNRLNPDSQFNPYPRELLTPDQVGKYESWQRMYGLCDTPPPEGTEIGAVVMPTGDLDDRVGPSLALFIHLAKTQSEMPHLVITGKWSNANVDGGGVSAEKAVEMMRAKILEDDSLDEDFKRRLTDRLIAENEAGNTAEQGRFLHKLMEDGKIKGPLLADVSPYHVPRFIATVVKQFDNIDQDPTRRPLIYAAPIEFLSWHDKPPLDWNGARADEPRWKLALDEAGKMARYTKDVASEQEMVDYSWWLRAQGVEPQK